jgi:hypothetical protein
MTWKEGMMTRLNLLSWKFPGQTEEESQNALITIWPILVIALFKAWFCGRSLTGIASYYRTRVKDICLV